MSAIKNVTLKFSCAKTRESMEISADGYSCSDCFKEVIDFTNKSESELLELIRSSNSPICGLFKPSQLSRKFLKYAAATAIVGSSFVITAHGQHPVKTETIKQECGPDVLFGEIAGGDTEVFYAEPIGGYEKFNEAVMNNINYPKSLEVGGRLYLQIVVDTSGMISSVEVLKGFNKIADEEAVRAVRATNFPFKPADKDGTPVESQLIIPLNFKKRIE